MKLAIMIVMLALSFRLPACEVADARLNLKKWGLAYCLKTHYPDGEARAQASRAMGGYFQLGSHNSEDAYRNVREFIDMKMKSHPALGKHGEVMHFSACLDAYESDEYRSFINNQDQYLGFQEVSD